MWICSLREAIRRSVADTQKRKPCTRHIAHGFSRAINPLAAEQIPLRNDDEIVATVRNMFSSPLGWRFTSFHVDLISALSLVYGAAALALGGMYGRGH